MHLIFDSMKMTFLSFLRAKSKDKTKETKNLSPLRFVKFSAVIIKKGKKHVNVQQKWQSNRERSDKSDPGKSEPRKISHLKRREPRLCRLQQVSQEVDGPGHACKHNPDGTDSSPFRWFLTPKHKTRIFWDVALCTFKQGEGSVWCTTSMFPIVHAPVSKLQTHRDGWVSYCSKVIGGTRYCAWHPENYSLLNPWKGCWHWRHKDDGWINEHLWATETGPDARLSSLLAAVLCEWWMLNIIQSLSSSLTMQAL